MSYSSWSLGRGGESQWVRREEETMRLCVAASAVCDCVGVVRAAEVSSRVYRTDNNCLYLRWSYERACTEMRERRRGRGGGGGEEEGEEVSLFPKRVCGMWCFNGTCLECWWEESPLSWCLPVQWPISKEMLCTATPSFTPAPQHSSRCDFITVHVGGWHK